MNKFENKVALVTGGSRGLGREAVLKLAGNGSDIIFTYNTNKKAADEVSTKIAQLGRKAVALQFDQSNISSIGRFVESVSSALSEHWQRDSIDFLVNNAGIGKHEMLADLTEETFDSLMKIHFKGVLFLTKNLLSKISDGGRIVNISTGLARFSLPAYRVYASMKGAMEVSTRYLAKELGGRGITVNIVAPGAIDNDFNKESFDSAPQLREIIAGNTALGRVGVSEDIGGVVGFLCSENAGWITGQRIEASGGMFI